MTAWLAPRLTLPLSAAALAAVMAVTWPNARPPSVPHTEAQGLAAGNVARPRRADLSEADRRRVAAVTRPARDVSRPEPFEAMAGGAGTSTARVDRSVLTHPAGNLTAEGEQSFRLGSALFEKLWVSSPSSTQASDGLGPLYNARSCETCHVRDGRGHPPQGAASSPSLVLKFASRRNAGEGDPVYGHQLQDSGVPGLSAEGHLALTYEDQPVTLSGGERVTLHRPVYGVERLAYGPLDVGTGLSPRLAPAMTGLGLLEAIHPDDILAHADPDDRDGDGISGRPSMVTDPDTGGPAIGRFGWKAQAATIRAQAAIAFATDIGISTPVMPQGHGDCTSRQPACLAMEDGVQPRLGSSEAPDPVLDLVAFYARHLAVPARRDVGAPAVLRGKQMFTEAGCAACHTPKFVTRRDAESPSQAFQLIWPYSDLLLHDMGDGLADRGGPPDVTSMAREWRTPPLWGIGLAGTVDGRAAFLHDGRARTLLEAVLWHGGEAQAARDRFVSLDATDRRALIAFLESL